MRAVAWVGLACTLAFGLLVASLHAIYPRDEQAYLTYVRTYGNFDGNRLGSAIPAGDLVAAGDRACDWIRQQPPALWRTAPELRRNSLSARYESQLPESALPHAVVPGAWTYLCPAVVMLVKPHTFFWGPEPD